MRMVNEVYTNYWVNQRDNVKKEHGSYRTEEEAIEAILTWWEIHNKKPRDILYERTNRGALEILYGDSNYYYRIEKRKVSEPLPSTSYKVKSKGEIEALRNKYRLDETAFTFDELPEPHRDRLVKAFGDSSKCRDYSYTAEGQPIVKLEELNRV